MAFTKIAAPAGIDTGGSIVVQGINAIGVITASSIIATNATFGGNVSIAGTVTYEDVTNIDSLGIITARTGVKVTTGGVDITAGGLNVTAGLSTLGITSATNLTVQQLNISGVGTVATLNITQATPTNLNVLGVSTLGVTSATNLTAQNLIVSGIATVVTELDVGVGGTAFTVLPSGNVGVGTINPVGQLQVSSGPVIIGAATSTGTANQRLQVTGGAYVSGNLGIGTTNSGNSKVEIVGLDGGIGLGINNNSAIAFKDNTGTSRRAALLSSAHAYYYGDVDNNTSNSNLFLLANNAIACIINGTTRASVSSNGITVGAGGTVITTTASGLVGVGTTNPSSTVDILGLQANTGSTSASFPTGTLKLGFDGGAVGGTYGSSLVFSQRWNSPNNSQVAVGQITGVKIAGDGNFGGGLAFFTSDTTNNNLAERLRITSTGAIGIGTNNPAHGLQVNGSAAKTSADGSAVAFSSNDAANAFQLVFQRNASTDSVPVWSISSVEQSVAYRTLSLQPSGGNTLIGMGGGNLGVGTNNPTQKLSVSNNILLGTAVSGATATPSYIDLGLNYSNGTTRDKCKLYLYNDTTGDTTQKYGFTVGSSSDIQYHSHLEHGFYVANTKVASVYNTSLGTIANTGFGLDIGYKKSVTITGSFAANIWYNTGIDRTTDTGIYLLSAYVDTYSAGGQSYQMSYVGWFVMPNRASNSTDTSTITLHRAGHAPNAEGIQFRTLLTPAASDNKIYLQWQSNFALTLDGSGGRNIQVAIYRFGTPLNN